jgi:glycosyltransferase involved in cell wall biosynthesis
MNITMLVLNEFTRDARVHKEASSLARAGHDVKVLALHRTGLPIEESISGYSVRRLELKTKNWRDGIIAPAVKYLELISRLLQVTKAIPADLYHSHDANSLLATYFAVKRDKSMWIYDSHELETGRNFKGSTLAPYYRYLWHLPERLFINRVDAVISASPSYANQLRSIYGIKNPTIIKNAPEYIPPTKSCVLRDYFGIPKERIILLYQGVVTHNRGIGTTIHSLYDIHFPIDFVIVGDGIARPYFEKLAEDLGLNKRIHFMGYVPHAKLHEHTLSADIGLSLIQNSSPSYFYSLPNKIFEYLMAGLPVIVSDFPAMGQIVRDYQAGIVVSDPSSPKAVALAINTMLENREKFRNLKKNAFQAAKILNWENEENVLLTLYNELSQRRCKT